jgi:hypothetical protein
LKKSSSQLLGWRECDLDTDPTEEAKREVARFASLYRPTSGVNLSRWSSGTVNINTLIQNGRGRSFRASKSIDCRSDETGCYFNFLAIAPSPTKPSAKRQRDDPASGRCGMLIAANADCDEASATKRVIAGRMSFFMVVSLFLFGAILYESGKPLK